MLDFHQFPNGDNSAYCAEASGNVNFDWNIGNNSTCERFGW